MYFTNKTAKKIFASAWLMLLFALILGVFWQQEWKYSLPTPVPSNYNPVKPGEYVALSDKLFTTLNKPVFIHFFNPDCPCSRFNAPQFNSLVKKYGSQITFAVVVINKGKDYTAAQIRDKFNFNVPVLSDTSIASLCGVYSTPQAVLLDGEHKLYYRGNYNRSRYCTEVSSNYAQIAIDSLLNNSPKPQFGHFALTAYGCQVSDCTK
jgi:thiol-disulfide isomerase/thioredoxin